MKISDGLLNCGSLLLIWNGSASNLLLLLVMKCDKCVKDCDPWNWSSVVLSGVMSSLNSSSEILLCISDSKSQETSSLSLAFKLLQFFIGSLGRSASEEFAVLLLLLLALALVLCVVDLILCVLWVAIRLSWDRRLFVWRTWSLAFLSKLRRRGSIGQQLGDSVLFSSAALKDSSGAPWYRTGSDGSGICSCTETHSSVSSSVDSVEYSVEMSRYLV